jgi:hypothetical protein
MVLLCILKNKRCENRTMLFKLGSAVLWLLHESEKAPQSQP